MKTKRSTLDDVKAKLKAAKEKTEEQEEEYDLEERLKELNCRSLPGGSSTAML